MKFFMLLNILSSMSIAHAEFDSIDLDTYYREKGYHFSPINSEINEGYTSNKEREIFAEELKKLPHITKIAEVGFNTGHSAEVFLESSNNSQLVSFDINTHYYIGIGVEFMQKKYNNRFSFVAGDSRATVPQYFQENPDQKFDLIFIDGCHLFDFCLTDIKNFKKLSHKNTILWIDDYDPINCIPVKNAVDHAEALGIIKVIKSYFVEDDSGPRGWVEAKYVY